MSCQSCGSITKTCGCTDTPYTTPIQSTCSTACPPKCAEFYDAACVLLKDGIVDLGINAGDSLEAIVQRIVVYLTNEPCLDTTAIPVKTNTITPLTIDLVWGEVTGATGYQVEYKLPSSGSWTLLPVQTTNTVIISGLTPATEYYIRVNTTTNTGTCYSVTISASTL
jgi:hypothetical protein